MLAQVFTPAVAVWSKEIAIRRTASEEWSPIPFYGQFGWLNFVVVLDILAVYCVWCLFQHAYQFVVGQNYKGNLYYHIVITGCTTSCIATINGVSSQFYEFAICMTSVDKGGPHCLDATGKRDSLNPVNAVQVRREEGGRGRQGGGGGRGREWRGGERRGETIHSHPLTQSHHAFTLCTALFFHTRSYSTGRSAPSLSVVCSRGHWC
jgi:hypothetical protein